MFIQSLNIDLPHICNYVIIITQAANFVNVLLTDLVEIA